MLFDDYINLKTIFVIFTEAEAEEGEKVRHPKKRQNDDKPTKESKRPRKSSEVQKSIKTEEPDVQGQFPSLVATLDDSINPEAFGQSQPSTQADDQSQGSTYDDDGDIGDDADEDYQPEFSGKTDTPKTTTKNEDLSEAIKPIEPGKCNFFIA